MKLEIVAYMISCRQRAALREQTLANLRRTDWGAEAVVQLDDAAGSTGQERQTLTALHALQRVVADEVDVALFLEDDLDFNRHLRHNLEHWEPLRRLEVDAPFFGSLYNPNIRVLHRQIDEAFFVADSEAVYGSQAFLLSARTARYVVENWLEIPGMQDIKMSRLAARLGTPLYYHSPSLVQHVGTKSVWGGHFHAAASFDRDWRA